MNNQIVKIGGQQLDLSQTAYGHCLSATGSLLGPRRYVAQKFGLCKAKNDKGNLDWSEIKDMNTKAVVEAIVATGAATEDQVKAEIKAYNTGKEAFYKAGNMITGLIAADPTLRKDVRVSTGKNGVIGFNVKARFVKDKAAQSQGRIAQLEAQIAKLTAALGEKALAATA